MKNKVLFLLIIAGFILYACKKNDFSGPPVISSVRSIDTLKRDSFFVKAFPGSLVVIQGSNLGGLQAVFFNDTLAYFNPVYATNTNVIITIPATAQTKATLPSAPDVIKLVTNHGSTTFAFQLYLPPPYISSIALDNSGTVLTINGGNFQGVKKITFPVTGGPSGDTAVSYTVNKAFNQIVAVVPAGTPFADSLHVMATFGTAAYSFPPPMTISSISNENGIAGTTLLINGTNFIGVTKVVFPGNILGTNLQNISVNKLSVTVPAGITAPDSLRVMGILGVVAAPQLFDSYITHTSPGYLSTFEVQYAGDNTGFVGWTGGYSDSPTTATKYPKATGAVGYLQQGSPMPPGTNPGSQGNAGFVQLNDVPWVSNTATSVSNYSLKFEVYTANPWAAGEIWVMMGDWYGWHNWLARYAPWSTDPSGKFQPGGWVTATIPLKQFVSISGNAWDLKAFPAGNSPTLFSDFSATSLCFTIVNDQASPSIPANTLNLAIDNIRIVKGQ
jgi:Surface glycan-binding protein B xyloglucan binding domain/IPT/TIG domain